LKQNPPDSTFFVVNAQGLASSSGHPLPPTPISVKTRKYFQDAIRTKDFSVGEYAIFPAAKRSVLHFAYPIIDAKKQLKGVIAISLDLGRDAWMFPMEKLPQGSALSLQPQLPQSESKKQPNNQQ
jgi:C4-dicarboxylate-specific signal transduction histidine kinase